ncbi:MAG: flavodoxin-dependent (E)-4-hydroxy-3-methylbut-2-enyl-diphosphate synthase [Firmicutes bacterium]|nr:flavodoxin-dependent (E)-4-hydroxy-3-methylbut-2-enyl-diphosphate synthase [Bacillota bacterium]
MFTHEDTRRIYVGGVSLGGGAPIRIQSMTNTPTADVRATVEQILRLEDAGCEIVRSTVPDLASAEAIREIRRQIHIPLVADIHFDHRMAIAAMENGADKIRINPGNIGSLERVRKVVETAKERQIPIRVGVNAGSLEKELLERYGGPTAEALAESALRSVRLIEDLDYDQLVVSMKASNIRLCADAHRLFAEQRDYPLHIGITEAGTVRDGTIKSAMGLGILLYARLGDTMRVSLTGDPVEEIYAAQKILTFSGERRFGVELISCPTCGRTKIDLIGLAARVEEALKGIDRPMKVAVMGCVVNGPGEAREADYGIAGGEGEGLLFKKGKILRKVPEDQLLDALLDLIRQESE